MQVYSGYMHRQKQTYPGLKLVDNPIPSDPPILLFTKKTSPRFVTTTIHYIRRPNYESIAIGPCVPCCIDIADLLCTFLLSKPARLIRTTLRKDPGNLSDDRPIL